jgi:hypothetical protein
MTKTLTVTLAVSSLGIAYLAYLLIRLTMLGEIVWTLSF